MKLSNRIKKLLLLVCISTLLTTTFLLFTCDNPQSNELRGVLEKTDDGDSNVKKPVFPKTKRYKIELTGDNFLNLPKEIDLPDSYFKTVNSFNELMTTYKFSDVPGLQFIFSPPQYFREDEHIDHRFIVKSEIDFFGTLIPIRLKIYEYEHGYGWTHHITSTKEFEGATLEYESKVYEVKKLMALIHVHYDPQGRFLCIANYSCQVITRSDSKNPKEFTFNAKVKPLR